MGIFLGLISGLGIVIFLITVFRATILFLANKKVSVFTNVSPVNCEFHKWDDFEAYIAPNRLEHILFCKNCGYIAGKRNVFVKKSMIVQITRQKKLIESQKEFKFLAIREFVKTHFGREDIEKENAVREFVERMFESDAIYKEEKLKLMYPEQEESEE